MTVEEFNRIPFEKRYQIVALKGKLLSYFAKENMEERLFRFKNFRVKVKFDPDIERYTEVLAYQT
jgi:hypothetical protein